MRFSGRTALVTGAGNGIGQAIALAFAGEGAEVVVNDIDLAVAEATADEIKARGGQAIAINADVSLSGEVKHMFESALQRFGKVDILVNNAGGGGQESGKLFHETSEADWDLVIGRNLKGTMICTREVINHMMQRRYGRIINIASAIVGAGGRPNGTTNQVVYSTAKAAIITFTRKIAKEAGPYGINISAVSPGTVETAASARWTPATIKIMADASVVGRLGQPAEIANLVLFLATAEAEFMLGQEYIIDGGQTL
jgi:NAD(P)-dependent dehydrogenase (short-subunit alcohol dehydrogenase family)